MNPLNGRPFRPVRSGSSSTATEKTAERIRGAASGLISRLSAGTVTIGVLVLAIIFATLWYSKVYASPEKVFWGTMKNNLSTPGVTKEIGSKGAGGSSNQIAQLVFVPEPRMRLLQQQTLGSTAAPTTVKLESVVTPSASYQHYLSIDRTAVGNKKLDYSSIYPLWVKDTTGRTSSTFSNALFSTAVLCGNVTLGQRNSLLDKLHSAYSVDFGKAERKENGGRRLLVYGVSINLKKYAEADTLYARYIGLPNAQHLSPGNFTAKDKISASFTIDVMAHEVRQVSYKTTNTQEQYSGYGIHSEINPPAKTATTQELQKALQGVK